MALLLDKDRSSLRCLMCGQKGGCVQCAGGRCLLSYHPWCLIHSPKGVVHRSIDTKSQLFVSLFCRCWLLLPAELHG